MNGVELRRFSDVKAPRHLSVNSEGRVLVADFVNHRILLLNQDLKQQRVLVDTHSQVKLWQPTRLCYNDDTSQLYVVHGEESSPKTYFVSVFNLHSAPNASLPASPSSRVTSGELQDPSVLQQNSGEIGGTALRDADETIHPWDFSRIKYQGPGSAPPILTRNF